MNYFWQRAEELDRHSPGSPHGSACSPALPRNSGCPSWPWGWEEHSGVKDCSQNFKLLGQRVDSSGGAREGDGTVPGHAAR